MGTTSKFRTNRSFVLKGIVRVQHIAYLHRKIIRNVLRASFSMNTVGVKPPLMVTTLVVPSECFYKLTTHGFSANV